MNNLRKYGSKPYTVVLIHGGPGGPGEMKPVACELSKDVGVLEPLQMEKTIDAQIEELRSLLVENACLPITLIGFSWGAWLSLIFAAKFPKFVKKLILVSSGPFKEKYAENIINTRIERLNKNEKEVLTNIVNILDKTDSAIANKLFLEAGILCSKADAYEELPHENDIAQCQYDVYKAIWGQAKQLRKSKALLEYGKQVKCSVVAIHGDYDTHPFEGVQKPLSTVIKDFRFILLKRCGHHPWYEKYAKDKFYELIKK